MRPDVIPQLADAEEVLDAIERPDGVALSVLIPNERGLERALEHRDRFDEVNLFLSATETHNRKNVNRSIEESLAGLERTIERARSEGLRCEGVISVVVRLPVRGRGAARARVRDRRAPRRRRLRGGRVRRHDGNGEPAAGAGVLRRGARALPDVELTAHFHNTRGQGLANVLAALETGVESFESLFGELGGCPVPPGATGNIATEDLVSMLHEMGIETGDRPGSAARPPRGRCRSCSAARSGATC